MYKINEIDNFKFITFPSLLEFENLFHCFTTRVGGVSEGVYSSLNLGLGTDDDIDKVNKNYKILSEKLLIDIDNIVKPYQTHTSNIEYVTEEDKGKLFEKVEKLMDVDGLITDRKNVALITLHADCTPVFFYDSVKNIIGMAHAGWRGTVQNIAGKMAKKFIEEFNSNPKNIKTAIGPSLGQCCFEVDKDVADMFLSEDSNYENYMITKEKKYYFDLWEINKYQMMKQGIEEKNIEISGLCTKCHNDLFFSHRGQKGKRGLMAGIIMMK